jgi:hypothetical protein
MSMRVRASGSENHPTGSRINVCLMSWKSLTFLNTEQIRRDLINLCQNISGHDLSETSGSRRVKRDSLWESCAPYWATGTRDKPIAPASPWQNGFAERLIGSIRRKCLDHVVIWGEAHLRRILKSYADYYNSVRTHRSLHKDAPISRPIHQTGIIRSHPILGGLHHHYVRV